MALPSNPQPTSDTEVALEPVPPSTQTAVGLEPITDPVHSATGLEAVSTNDQTAIALPPVLKGPAPTALYLKWGPLGAGLAILVLGLGLYLLDGTHGAEPAIEGRVDLVVSSRPEGARVVVDGRPLSGGTPVTVRNLAPERPHTVIVDLPGYQRWSQHLKLTASNPNTVHAVLQPAQP